MSASLMRRIVRRKCRQPHPLNPRLQCSRPFRHTGVHKSRDLTGRLGIWWA